MAQDGTPAGGVVRRPREWANEQVVRLRAWRIARRARRDRMLVVALNQDGSVQQFFHFLLGFYAPLTVWLLESGGRPRIRVRDCGPMNPWFATLDHLADIEVVRPGQALRQLAGRQVPRRLLKGLDRTQRLQARPLRRAREAMLTALHVDPDPGAPFVLVVDRLERPAFYQSAESENPLSGADRRSVPNLSAAVAAVPIGESVQVVDLALMPPSDQVRLTRGARVLVGQHGAGLAHMIWLEPGSTVVEIRPPLPDEVVSLFAELAAVFGHHFVLVPQESPHALVDEALLAAAIADAVRTQNGSV